MDKQEKKSDELSKVYDYQLHCKENYFLFDGDFMDFPFDYKTLCSRLDVLNSELKSEFVSSTRLHFFPNMIFVETELIKYPELSKYVYNIIETWSEEYRYKIHNGKKNRTFDNFLEECKCLSEKSRSLKILQPELENKKLNISQIALKYVYDGIQITRQNGNKIIESFGYKSGEKLFQKYTFFLSKANRKGKPKDCTAKKLQNKIELIESVIPLILPNNIEDAKEDILALKKILENEY